MAPIAADRSYIGVRSAPDEVTPVGISLTISAIVVDEVHGQGTLSREDSSVAGDGRARILGHLLAQLYAPLVTEIDPPDDALHEGDVLVKHDGLTENRRRRLGGHDRRRRLVVREDAGGHDCLGHVFGVGLLDCLPGGESLGLDKEIAKEQLMLVRPILVREHVARSGKGDEVGRNQLSPLMNELIEGVLAIYSGLAPEYLVRSGGNVATVSANALVV